ncbi:MAG: leucine--tRNA ligase [Firmicutes bacterium]|nr:leucine--tRNA ligase [Bacillota bacterium]
MAEREGEVQAAVTDAVERENRDRYNVKRVEARWQQVWSAQDLYRTPDPEPGQDRARKYYCLEQFPYPSGHLHMGHVRVYTLGDVIARYRRMRGDHVLHPMGWDAFGLPAENAAIKSGVDPQHWTETNIEYMKRQMQGMGLSFDWQREVRTCNPDYYRFTQELFLLLYERGLAYRKAGPVNWCPSCETVLANEQVEEGRCWRCDSLVEKRDLTQWYFRITDYAQRLLDDLDRLHWPEEIKVQQRNWIGRSEGAVIRFPLPEPKAGYADITVFSTRPDTLYGATYVVLAPEHPLVEALIEGLPQAEAVRAFVAEERRHSEIERTAETTEKRGLFTGAYALHPLTGEPVPVWVANYVLVDYGTGAVMGVPAHDQRDYLFARKYGLPVVTVVEPETGEAPADAAWTGPGRLVRSGPFSGLTSEEGKTAITAELARRDRGGSRITYRMRDWLISRQRYWGAPIPVVHCDRCGVVPVPRDQLPVLLPENVVFTGTGRSPLAGAQDWVETTCPACGGPARRETDTMDTFVDSSWYYLRYASPEDTTRPFDPARVAYWMPVDEYVGGKEHAVLHLLYSRFFTKVLYDAGLVPVDEPFSSLLAQGMVIYQGKKMSKSKGNTLSPEEIIAHWGADATRVFMLFAAPPEKDFEWSDQGVEGAYRFLQRVYRLAVRLDQALPAAPDAGAEAEAARRRARTVRKVGEDIERRTFNTAISALMEWTNSLYQLWEGLGVGARREHLETLVQLLAPFAPHLAEELWHRLGHADSVHRQPWPGYDPALLVEQEVEIALQVNGRVRAKLRVAREAGPEQLEQLAVQDQRLAPYLNGRRIVKVVAIPGRLVNVVVA